MAQKFQQIKVKKKEEVFHIDQWVDIPDPFGKHKTRKAIVVGVSSSTISVKPCYTHFDDAVILKRSKPAKAPNGVECRMLEEVYHYAKHLVSNAVFH